MKIFDIPADLSTRTLKDVLIEEITVNSQILIENSRTLKTLGMFSEMLEVKVVSDVSTQEPYAM